MNENIGKDIQAVTPKMISLSQALEISMPAAKKIFIGQSEEIKSLSNVDMLMVMTHN